MGIKTTYKWYDNRHNQHRIRIQLVHDMPHYAELRCTDCDKWIKWLSRKEFEVLTNGKEKRKT